jgi:dephospho-CoA kinase
MSAWSGKYVIGLTGNIATGKSVVRKMLEHLGAYGIDADALVHRALAQDAPGYKPVVEMFGKWVIGENGGIDRTKLGHIVFSDPEAMKLLENITHPLVRQAVDVLCRRATQKIVVIEAIKLIEGPLRSACDSIWVTYASFDVQLARLMEKRSLNETTARQRINAQTSQDEKRVAAHVVINNIGSYEDTWRQVSLAWQALFPNTNPSPVGSVSNSNGVMVVERARPRQADEIARFINRICKKQPVITQDDIMATFGEKAYLILRQDGKFVGLMGWQVENLVARTPDVYLEPGIPVGVAMRILLDEVERASRELQCEVLLLFLPPQLASYESVWRAQHYEPRAISHLGVRAWQEAATESMPAGTILLFKQLRKDRVLRPV